MAGKAPHHRMIWSGNPLAVALPPIAIVGRTSQVGSFVPAPDSCTASLRGAESISYLISQAFSSFTRTVFVSVGRQLGKFPQIRCRFELPDRALGDLRITVQVEFFQDGAHISQRVSAEGCYLRLTASGQRQTRDRAPSEIMKRESDNSRFSGRGAKCCLEGVRGPWLPATVEQDKVGALFLGRSERSFKRHPYRNDHARTGLALLEPDMRAVIACPRKR
jgi:hypothetical protein